MKTPECDKIAAVRDKSQVVGEFLEWLQGEKHINLAEYHKHNRDCLGCDCNDIEDCPVENPDNCNRRMRKRVCGCSTDTLLPIGLSVEKLLAEFFNIDLEKVDAERRVLLAEMRVK